MDTVLANTSRGFRHPERLRLGGRERVLIEDSWADRIQRGDPTLHWEGDDRLALYLNVTNGRWELWRREADEKMRLALHCDAITYRGFDAVAHLLVELSRIDSHKGHDIHLEVVEHNRRRDKAVQDESDARTEATADKLAHALRRDVVHVI